MFVCLFVVWGFFCLFVCRFACLFGSQQDYLQSIEWICMNLLPEVCLSPRNNPFNLGEDSNYDP